jgi:hypothetical protein
MSLISRVIKSLINGISEQAPSVRLDNQVEDQENMIPDISGVLTRRSPVTLDDIIVQDGSRVYADEHAMFTMTIGGVLVSLGVKPDGTVYRFDENFADTTTITQAASVKTYLTHTDKKDISVVETSDKLFILNRGITVALNTSPTASTSTYTRSLIWVTAAFLDATYTITHYAGGTATLVGSHKAVATDTPKSIITKLISSAATNMTAAIPLTKTFHQDNNTVIVRNDGLDYFEVECDFGDHIKTIAEANPSNTKTMLDPAILPVRVATGVADTLTPVGTDNFLVRVNPSVNEDLNTYYLKYSSEFDAWVEVNNIYIDTINIETMPCSIIKDTVTTITVDHSLFSAPLAGDNLSNPPPTVVGSKLKDMIIFNSRIGFATESTLVFSVIDDYLNLYRTTTSAFLISDAVDLELDSSKLGYRTIDNIFSMDNNIIINTGLSQSMLALPQNLDISRAIFAQVSTFDLGSNVPVPIRRSMYFPIKSGSFSTVKAFSPDTETGVGFTDNSVTKHCEKLIRGTVIQSIFSNDIYLVRTTDDAKVLYVQHTYVAEGTVLQNAWHKWTFKYDIKYIYSTGDELKIVFEDTANTQTIYGSLELNPAEITEDTDTQIGYVPYLDYQTANATLALLLDSTLSVDTELGKLVTVGAANSIQGNTFVSRVVLSEIIPKSQGADGSQTKLGYALLMLRRMAVTLGYSGRFKINITRTKRVVYNHTFIPELLGNIVIGREPVNVRSAKFPINGRSQDVTIEISTVDTFTPLQIISLEWQGQLITQGGR